MKFSLIIPCYNVEKYIVKCLDHIVGQTYDNFEAIIVNDGSKDHTEDMILPYVKKDNRLQYFKKENSGVSDTRNFGLGKATGDYYLFIDSDDYIDFSLLEYVGNYLKEHDVDLIKFRLQRVTDNGTKIEDIENHYFDVLETSQAVSLLLKDRFIDTLWMHVYKSSLFKKNHFQFPVGKVHEDFALIPCIIRKAKKISSVDYVGYYYVQRENSIMSNTDYEKIKKRVYDFLSHYDQHVKTFVQDDIIDHLLLSYSAESTIYKGHELNSKDQKQYLKELKKRNIYQKIYPSSLKKYLKKLYLTFFTLHYYKRSK